MRPSSTSSLLTREVPPLSWIHPALFVGVSNIDGLGVFTSVALAKDTRIVVWGGQVFSKAEVARGLGRQHTLVGISEDLLLGNPADQPPGVDDYMNHSCNPNVGMSDEITLVTMRDVAPDEELTADYAIWLNDEGYVMKKDCKCGADDCRRQVLGTDWQRKDIQLANANYFSPFILRRISDEGIS